MRSERFVGWLRWRHGSDVLQEENGTREKQALFTYVYVDLLFAGAILLLE